MTLNNDTQVFKGNTPWNGKIFRGTTLIWPTVTDEYEKQYLTFEVKGNQGGEFKFHSASGLPQPLDIEFSKNDGPWVHYVSASTADKTVAHGDKIRVKGTNDTYTSNMGSLGYHYSQMWISGGTEYHIYGNIMSLIYGDSYIGKRILTSSNWHCFHSLFAAVEQDGSGANNGNNCTSAENLCLPATTLAEGCYSNMFAFSNIATAPKLPSRTLSNYCYEQMFFHCASLVSAPELPATTLAYYCYEGMFSYCASLINPPILPATILAEQCYEHLFSYCTSLVNAPELPATSLTRGCYHYMFIGCTSLVNAPELPATSLIRGCYSEMFKYCTSLNYAKCLATDIPAADMPIDFSTWQWMFDVSPTGTFIKHPNATWPTGFDGIPSGWTVQDAVL